MVQILTPGQVVDWKKGLSHQHLDVSYLITDRGERIEIKDLTPDIIYDSKYFVAGEEEIAVTASQIAEVMSICYRCGEDGVEHDEMRRIMENQLVILGFSDISLP
jgi:hypothetical protein